MNYPLKNVEQVHVNIMESLVEEEIDKQLEFYPKNLKSYLNRIEVATYALNRLPALYASSVIGREQQKRIGKKKYKEQITAAVRRALAAVERDPLRQSTPLTAEASTEYELANTALEKLQNFLYDRNLLNYNQSLSWNNLTVIIQEVFQKIHPQKSDNFLLESDPMDAIFFKVSNK